jgi:signal transduction histidine kinase
VVGLRLQHRIVIPFAIVALVATAAAAFVSLSVTSRALQSRLQNQLLSAASVISRGDLALNPIILRNLHEVINAHIVTFDIDGRVVASTAADSAPTHAAALQAVAAYRQRGGEDALVVPLDCGAPCVVAVRAVDGRPGYTVALLAETTELAAATRAVARTILLAAALSGIVLVLVSQAVVRRVTAPLDRLVSFVRQLSPNNRGRRAEVGRNEVGALALAFNDMLERLEQAQDALVRTEKLALAGQIAARVAHDIRNPLSSIKMETQLVRARTDLDPEAQESLSAVLHDIDQVESVIRDLLELARPGELRLQPESVNDVVADALTQLGPQFRHRKISVDAQFGRDLPAALLDRNRLKQVFLNVLVNASEAMPTGGRISITTQRAESELVVEICDDGVGVDPATLSRVFDPFVSTKPDGVGLGLVNAKSVVELHGGRIQLAPRVPRGTCACIWLPLSTPTHTAHG